MITILSNIICYSIILNLSIRYAMDAIPVYDWHLQICPYEICPYDPELNIAPFEWVAKTTKLHTHTYLHYLFGTQSFLRAIPVQMLYRSCQRFSWIINNHDPSQPRKPCVWVYTDMHSCALQVCKSANLVAAPATYGTSSSSQYSSIATASLSRMGHQTE